MEHFVTNTNNMHLLAHTHIDTHAENKQKKEILGFITTVLMTEHIIF